MAPDDEQRHHGDHDDVAGFVTASATAIGNAIATVTDATDALWVTARARPTAPPSRG